MRIIFLGTNGWYASPKTGNTTCALIETADRNIVLDAGDGFAWLSEHATDRKKPIDVFLSHFHIDHVAGLHMLPKIGKGARVRIFVQPKGKKAIMRLLDHPYTASPYEQFAKVSVHELAKGKNTISDRQGRYEVHVAPLVHADPCIGFRFALNGKDGKRTVAYCTDTGPCKNYLKLAKGADLLITECGLLPGAKTNPEWPHLSPESAAGLAKEAGCKKLVLTHFAAHHYKSMEMRDTAQRAAAKIFPAAIAAKDGMAIGF